MTSHVVVIDSTARRAVVKVTATKHLSDVLEEACSKLGTSASQYGLKHNNKIVDLSRTFRLSGLSSGAKLELVQLSRSASVVSVALQLPEPEGNTRLTDKFPSTTTLWLVLRKFEAGVAGDASTKRNLTARGAPVTDDGSSGAGRLYYQTPVLQVMSRELSSFTDLQKTLAQLGFNSGSMLIRLNFKTSETPLEEAMVQIAEYFKSVNEGEDNKEEGQDRSAPEAPSEARDLNPASNEADVPASEALTETSPSETTPATSDLSTSVPSAQGAQPTSTGRPVQIFSPPTSNTPSAALATYNPADYVPSIEHAKAHQRHLQEKSRNARLPSEAELAEQETAEAEKLKALKDVEIKIRFPDQSSAVSTFGQDDTGAGLYTFVRDDCLDERWKGEKFLLSYSANKGWVFVPDDPNKRLIRHLGLKGRVLVNFKWDENGGASMAALATKDVLKGERKKEAQVLKAPEIPATAVEGDEEGVKVDLGKKEDEGGEKKKKGMPKWLKLPGKK
ncbi:hypothetical protein EPUS_03275 [Endocarpon pusillum Z07020]|uniref:TUG ubiquitin-like domain-containing protein n=1 Tax=Endocarpon pusillum (strain Z07020 / HMAS-L-300199) TaxID=1263415 RepID=U1GGT5_ENDPU|nr:uncharacterized protein EPUS_03275 [Endocarpon pusillum Z07020]ERF70996.1 hypothetical protein EPUS_03275 [Endocarpon pusillum Z07020]